MTQPRLLSGTTQPTRVKHDDLNLMDYLNICRERVWLIVGMALTFALLAAVWSYLQHPLYQAKATVVIEQEGPGALERDKYYRGDVSPEYFQTHFELMKSHAVLERAAHQLHVADRPEYRSEPANEKFSAMRLLPEGSPHQEDSKQAPPKIEGEEQLLEAFAGNIEIMPIRGTRLAYVLARSQDPEFAALAANTVASVYIDYSEELASSARGKAAKWFTSHLDDLRIRVETAQRSLHEYRSKHGLLGERERQPIASHNLVETNSELVKAEVRKAEAQMRYQQIESALRKGTHDGSIDWGSFDASTEVLTSPLIQNLRTQEIGASRQLAELSEKYGLLHPKLTRAKSELQLLQTKIQEEIQKIYGSVKREYEVAAARERAMREVVGQYKKEKLTQEQRHDIQLGNLEREAESSQHLYDIFLKVTKEADVSAGIRSGNVYLATAAVPNTKPVKPKKSLNTMLGLLVGLISGGATALFLEMRNRRVRGVGDVERYLPDVTILGSVPVVTKSISEADMHLVLPTRSLAGESFRAIRTSVLLANASELPSSFLITSPSENEGKTTLAVNLAIAIAQLRDTRVVLIDADLRTAETHPIFHVANGNHKRSGLVHFLLGGADREEILQPTDLPNLSVIPRGFCPPNPSELLHSKPMRELIRWCQAQGYYVIIDTSPTLLVTDPAVLASQVDGVLLVISAGQTRPDDCQTSLHRLTASGGKILGVVLQKAKMADLPYYSYPPQYAKAGDREAVD